MEKDFIIANEHGLHARPATLLVAIASKFDCEITITYNGVTVDLKSIMNVLSLGLKRGAFVTVRTDGVDEVEALKKISENIVKFNLR